MRIIFSVLLFTVLSLQGLFADRNREASLCGYSKEFEAVGRGITDYSGVAVMSESALKLYNVSGLAVSIEIPDDWSVSAEKTLLSAFSPSDVVLFYIDPFPTDYDGSTKEALKSYIEAEYAGDDLEIGNFGKIKLGDFEAEYWTFEYVDGDYGKAKVRLYAFETKNSKVMVTVDMLVEGSQEFEPAIDEMLKTLKNYEGSPAEDLEGKLVLHKKTGVKIWVPSDWESYNEAEELRAYSEGDVALIILELFSGDTWDKFSKKAEKSIKEYIAGDIGDDFDVTDSGKTDINGMDAYFVEYVYEDGGYGKAYSSTYAVSVPKGVVMFTYDILESGKDEYKPVIDKMLKSFVAGDSDEPEVPGDMNLVVVPNASLELSIPSDWDADNAPDKLSAYSPNDTVLLYVEKMNGKNFADYDSIKAIAKDMKAFAEGEYNYDLTFGKAEEATVGGMTAVSYPFTYYDESYGDISCEYYGIDTGKGISTIIFDVLNDGGDSYTGINDAILASVKYNDTEPDQPVEPDQPDGTPKNYTHAASHLQLKITGEWTAYTYDSDLSAYSPNSTVIMYLIPLNTKSLKDYKKKDELLKAVDEFIKYRYYSSMEYKLKDAGKEKIGGMDSWKFEMTYSDSTFGEIDVVVHAVDTGKGISMLIFDAIRKEADPYKDTIAEITASVAFYDGKDSGGGDTVKVDQKGSFHKIERLCLKIWVPDNFSIDEPKSVSADYDYHFWAASTDYVAILKVYGMSKDYPNLRDPGVEDVLMEYLTSIGLDVSKVTKTGFEKLNSKDSYFIDFNYPVDDKTKALCKAIAIDTGNGIAVYIEDVLDSGIKDYQEIIEKVKKSLEVIQVPYEGIWNPWK
ncbi:MAG: hypothetical protein A2Y33_07790 [Spirochaetes bacterium GWF1_51_8]|nr:MAG: hypothetical protein A2Y33_07790 [Spirochaetes bacterium GWF1_51_8]